MEVAGEQLLIEHADIRQLDVQDFKVSTLRMRYQQMVNCIIAGVHEIHATVGAKVQKISEQLAQLDTKDADHWDSLEEGTRNETISRRIRRALEREDLKTLDFGAFQFKMHYTLAFILRTHSQSFLWHYTQLEDFVRESGFDPRDI